MPDPQLLRGKGRPVKSRIRNEMDGVRRERGSRREDPELKAIQPRQHVECIIKRGIIAEAVPIPVGLRQVVVL